LYFASKNSIRLPSNSKNSAVTNFRCECPITSVLDVLGDKWTLVIVKMMLLEDRRTFKDFTDGDASIATNILASRLKMLEAHAIVTKNKLPDNKKVNIYRLTEKGIALGPLLMEIHQWGHTYLRSSHPDMTLPDAMLDDQAGRDAFVRTVQEQYRVGGE